MSSYAFALSSQAATANRSVVFSAPFSAHKWCSWQQHATRHGKVLEPTAASSDTVVTTPPSVTSLPAEGIHRAPELLELWGQFARNASGEWEGVMASFGPDGSPLPLPAYYVPDVSAGCPPCPALLRLCRLPCSATGRHDVQLFEALLPVPCRHTASGTWSYLTGRQPAAAWPTLTGYQQPPVA
jgi:hypothetical protein